MLTQDQISQLRGDLLRADYTLDSVLDRIGEAGQTGLTRNSSIPSRVAIASDTDPQAQLIRLFVLQDPAPTKSLVGVVDLDALTAAGLLIPDGDSCRAVVEVRPYGFSDALGEWSGWVVADPTPGMDQVITPTRPDYVLGVGPASTTLADLTVREATNSVLDLGTGCGVQLLHLSRHAQNLTATDLNPRALDLARSTVALNGIDADMRLGSLYGPVAADTFDLIVTNPPYVMSPPTTDAERLLYREGNHAGDGLVEAVVRGAADRLADGGRLQVLANWAELSGQPWQERLATWSPPGCDLWVIQREHLDIYSYIELWLTDAGLAGSPQWRPRYQQWLDYFAALNITGVGLGWITLTKAGRDQPKIRIEEWPWQVDQPVGTAIGHQRTADDWAGLPDPELLARRWQLAEDVVQETLGEPGAEHPRHVVLRQQGGLRRATQVDTALGGVLGACDGDLELGVIVTAVAELLDQDSDTLSVTILPQIRHAIRDGLLLAAR